MAITPSQLRKDIYNLLAKISKTGVPLEVECKGELLKIVPVKMKNKLDNLKKHHVLNCEPEELLNLDWSKEWQPFI